MNKVMMLIIAALGVVSLTLVDYLNEHIQKNNTTEITKYRKGND